MPKRVVRAPAEGDTMTRHEGMFFLQRLRRHLVRADELEASELSRLRGEMSLSLRNGELDRDLLWETFDAAVARGVADEVDEDRLRAAGW